MIFGYDEQNSAGAALDLNRDEAPRPPRASSLDETMTKAFNEQFERSVADSPVREERKRVEVDAVAAMRKFTEGGEQPTKMSGAEMFAIISRMKTEYGEKGTELEAELLKTRKMVDKKIALVDWLNQNIGPVAQPAPLTERNGMAARPTTAPPMHASGAMTDRSADPAAAKKRKSNEYNPPPTFAKPALMADGDALALLTAFAGGRDHLTMSGAEYHGLVAWLKAHGHEEIEDNLMRVKLLGDKKFQLAAFIKKVGAEAFCAAAAQSQTHAPPTPTPNVQSMVIDAQPTPVNLATTMPTPMAAPMAQPAPGANVFGGAGALGANPLVAIQSMEACLQVLPPSTLPVPITRRRPRDSPTQRMEETFNFAMESAQSDIAQARGQLRALRMAIGA